MCLMVIISTALLGNFEVMDLLKSSKKAKKIIKQNPLYFTTIYQLSNQNYL